MLALKEFKDNKFDLLLTDPPYAINYHSGWKERMHKKIGYKKIKNDNNLEWLKDWIKEINRVVKDDAHLYIFCSYHNIDKFLYEIKKYRKVKNILIWEKNNTSMGDLFGNYAPKYEMIIFCSSGVKKLKGSRDSNILKYQKTYNGVHPTQKPVKLLRYLIEKSTEENDLILDTFAGSFSSGFAAYDSKRKFIGYELDTEYFEAAKKRLKEHQQQIRMF